MTFGARTLGYLASGPFTALSTTLTIGLTNGGTNINARGFSTTPLPSYTPTTFGSLTSATLSDGKVCTSVYDDRSVATSTFNAVVRISGFGVTNPGQNYLYDVVSNGVTKVASTATLYTFSGGLASWFWEDTTIAPLFGFPTSGSTSLVIRLT